ncbi:MAG: anthranilate synthase component [Burkholderiales bacterium]|jgi:anthranilate synthase component 1|nr:anthranilate synthase component [Burkholderiales bacterium]
MQINLPKITKELRYDQLTPVLAYATIGGTSSCMMESAYDEGYGTYSFIGINPLATFKATGNNISITTLGKTDSFMGDPHLESQKFAHGYRVFGFLTYDTVRQKERLPDRHQPKNIPDFLFHIYKTVLRFDHKTQKVLFTHFGEESELDAIIAKVFDPVPVGHFTDVGEVVVKSDITDEEYMQMVKSAQEYIKAGDIFQVVLSRTFSAKIKVKPFDIYRALRSISPTPYLTFFSEEDFSIASASPELLVGVKNGLIESVPIAGTCKRGDDVNKLLADPKESAEHVMLVDLARNDVGSMSIPGSVQVAEYRSIKNYSHVSHIVSRVIGTLDPKYTPIEVLKASLPAGTLSGAPKIRAMEIIDELEYSRRGLYGGALLTIDEEGNLTSAIAIRTAFIQGDKLEVRVGAGIVLDSVPEKEAEETRLKARGVITALEVASGRVA